jgi:hypothetical protein
MVCCEGSSHLGDEASDNTGIDELRKRLSAFLDISKESVGVFGGGRRRPTGVIDVALRLPLGSGSSSSDNKLDEVDALIDVSIFRFGQSQH